MINTDNLPKLMRVASNPNSIYQGGVESIPVLSNSISFIGITPVHDMHLFKSIEEFKEINNNST